MLYSVSGSLVFGPAHALFDRRVGDGEDRNRDQNDDAWKHQPLGAISGGRDPQVVFGDLTEGKPEGKRRPRPAEFNHEVSNDAKNYRCDNVVDIVIGRE